MHHVAQRTRSQTQVLRRRLRRRRGGWGSGGRLVCRRGCRGRFRVWGTRYRRSGERRGGGGGGGGGRLVGGRGCGGRFRVWSTRYRRNGERKQEPRHATPWSWCVRKSPRLPSPRLKP